MSNIVWVEYRLNKEIVVHFDPKKVLVLINNRYGEVTFRSKGVDEE